MNQWLTDIIAHGTSSGWALCMLVASGMFLQWRIYARQRPEMRKLDMADETADGVRKADALALLNQRITDLETKVETAAALAHSAELKLVYAVSAVQLLAARIRTDNPNDPTLLQAMELLSAATSGGLPGWGSKLGAEISKIKGATE